MKLDRDSIVALLATNDRAVARAVIVLTERQTQDEQASSETRYQNGKGWRPCHARVGTSMAYSAAKYGRLTPRQVAYWRHRMACGNMRIAIYWRQLLEVAQQRQSQKHKTTQQEYQSVRG